MQDQFYLFCSYIKRFWKKPFFDLLDNMKVTLDHIYGEGKVTLIDASLRWMYHHSKMDGTHGGIKREGVLLIKAVASSILMH